MPIRFRIEDRADAAGFALSPVSEAVDVLYTLNRRALGRLPTELTGFVRAADG